MPLHAGVQKWVGDLNQCYRDHGALHELDFDPAGFAWIDCSDADASVVSLLRIGRRDHATVLVVCNFTPVVRNNYRVGAPRGGLWSEILNSDAKEYGGSGVGNLGGVEAGPVGCQGRRYSLCLTLPPLAILFLTSADATQQLQRRVPMTKSRRNNRCVDATAMAAGELAEHTADARPRRSARSEHLGRINLPVSSLGTVIWRRSMSGCSATNRIVPMQETERGYHEATSGRTLTPAISISTN